MENALASAPSRRGLRNRIRFPKVGVPVEPEIDELELDWSQLGDHVEDLFCGHGAAKQGTSERGLTDSTRPTVAFCRCQPLASCRGVLGANVVGKAAQAAYRPWGFGAC